MQSAQQPALAIAAIVKNEVPYLLEWIAYHRVLGVSRFFIADNGSTDGTRQFLGALKRCGLADAISFTDQPGQRPQRQAYAMLMQLFGTQAEWVAFIDADEFLFPADGARSLLPAIADLSKIGQLGALAVNWAIYGSAGRLRAAEGLVIEHYPNRGVQEAAVNAHYKSIVRAVAYRWYGDNPHVFNLQPGFQTYATTGEPVRHGSTSGLSHTAVWERIRLNHYVVKSFEEFLFRKRVRGRADTNEIIGRAFFDNHDLNDVHDPMPQWLLDAVREEMDLIMALIRDRKV